MAHQQAAMAIEMTYLANIQKKNIFLMVSKAGAIIQTHLVIKIMV